MGDPDRTISSDSCHIFMREVSLQYPWSASISSLGHIVWRAVGFVPTSTVAVVSLAKPFWHLVPHVGPTDMNTCCSMQPLVQLEKAGRRNIMFEHEVESASSVGSITTGWWGTISTSQGPSTGTSVNSVPGAQHLTGESCCCRAQVQCFSAALCPYHKPNDAAVASQAKNDQPCACNFGIGGGAPLRFCLLFLFLPGAGRLPIPGQRLVGTVSWKVTS